MLKTKIALAVLLTTFAFTPASAAKQKKQSKAKVTKQVKAKPAAKTAAEPAKETA